MIEKNILREKYQLSEADFLDMQKYMENMKELPADEKEAVEDRGEAFEEEMKVQLVEKYMKRVLELALKKVNRGVSLKKLLEYGIVGVVLEVDKTNGFDFSEELILQGAERYMERCLFIVE